MLIDPSSILVAIAALAAVLALIRAGQLLLRRAGLAAPAATGRRLVIIEQIAIDPRRRLLMIGCDGRTLLLLTGGGQDVPLGWVEPSGTAP
jgi:flagellar protein FliO/FliZ